MFTEDIEKINEFEMKMYGERYVPEIDPVTTDGYGTYVQIGDDRWNLEIIKVLYQKNYNPKKIFYWFDSMTSILNLYSREYERFMIDTFKRHLKEII